MKKILITLCILFVGLAASADFDEIETNLNMANFWQKVGKPEEKVITVGSRIVNANKLDKRIPFMVKRSKSIVNAFSYQSFKTVVVTEGILLYIDNDDELAFVLGHEIAHSLDAYEGVGKWAAMQFNSKAYEYKADLIGVDLMVKAGYNPVASITLMNKFFPESFFDWGVFTSHPKSSKRMLAIYKYIYKKYPTALDSDMTKNINYENFMYSEEKDINLFKQTEIERENRGVNKPAL